MAGRADLDVGVGVAVRRVRRRRDRAGAGIGRQSVDRVRHLGVDLTGVARREAVVRAVDARHRVRRHGAGVAAGGDRLRVGVDARLELLRREQDVHVAEVLRQTRGLRGDLGSHLVVVDAPGVGQAVLVDRARDRACTAVAAAHCARRAGSQNHVVVHRAVRAAVLGVRGEDVVLAARCRDVAQVLHDHGLVGRGEAVPRRGPEDRPHHDAVARGRSRHHLAAVEQQRRRSLALVAGVDGCCAPHRGGRAMRAGPDGNDLVVQHQAGRRCRVGRAARAGRRSGPGRGRGAERHE